MQVELVRGTIVESRHQVHAAVVDADETLIASAGDPDYVTFWRSAAKPFQAMPIVADGAADHFGISQQELALTCASHSSEMSQVELVRGFLKKIGCTERDLMCGPHPPLSDAVAKDYQTRGLRLTAVYSNCSGKHTGHARAGEAQRLADGGLCPSRSSRPETMSGRGGEVDGGAGGADRRCGRWLWSRVFCDSGEEYGPRILAIGPNAELGTRNAEPRPRVPRSAFRVPRSRKHASPPRADRG